MPQFRLASVSEGLLFVANGLIAKCVTGVGTFFSGLILAWVGFPQHGTPGQVDPAILHLLGMVFVPIVAAFGVTAITILSFYDIDRSRHQRNIPRLESADESTPKAAAKGDLPDAETMPIRPMPAVKVGSPAKG